MKNHKMSIVSILVVILVILPLGGVALLSRNNPLPTAVEFVETQTPSSIEEPSEMILPTVMGSQPDNMYPRPTGEWPLGIVHSNRQGIYIIPFDSPDQPLILESDEYYEPVFWAFPDQRGGLVYQHLATPEPWPAGAVLWMRAGSMQPELLIMPQAPWHLYSYPLAGIAPVGVTISSEGHALFVYIMEMDWRGLLRIMVVDLDNDISSREIMEVDVRKYRGLSGWHENITWIVGGDLVGLVNYKSLAPNPERCVTLTLFRIDDGSTVPSPFDSCMRAGPMKLSYDGQTLGMIVSERTLDLTEATLTMAVADLSTGEILEEGTIDVPGYAPISLVSNPGGWWVYVETSNDIRLLTIKGDQQVRIEKKTIPITWHQYFHDQQFYEHPLELDSLVSIDARARELPCQPHPSTLPAQDLPEAVAATRQLLFELASACDYQGLAELAHAHSTFVYMDGTTHRYSKEELVRSWITDGTDGGRQLMPNNLAAYREPLDLLATLLKTTPFYSESRGCVWIWPKALVEPNYDAWKELEQVLGVNEAWVLRRNAYDSGDFRIIISSDGIWRDFSPGSFKTDQEPFPYSQQC
jgi:hypothetical protein